MENDHCIRNELHCSVSKLRRVRGVKNIEIREFKLAIENYIQNSKMPLEIVRMVLKEIYEEVEQKTNEIMLSEIKERDLKEQEVKQDE